MLTPTTTIVQSSTCPLCHSNARREIDILIYARHFHDPETSPKRDVTDTDTGEIVDLDDVEPNDNFQQTFDEIQELLAKHPGHNTKNFALSDLIIHALNHKILSHDVGFRLKSEGKYLHAGNVTYQTPDSKDVLRLILAETAKQIAEGKIKMTAKVAIEAGIALWRMEGNSGGNDILDAIHEKISKGQMDTLSPLGKAYAERQQKLAVTDEADNAEPESDDA